MSVKPENNISEELQRLARLHADGALTAAEFASAKQQVLNPSQHIMQPFKGIRRQSSRTVFGLPLWAIAVGPDYAKGEMRGHARGIFALGDMATGWVAVGGLARGIVAIGGLAIGGLAFGGGAIGGIAMGGGALGIIAAGGGACGYYAFGGGAVGAHTVSAISRDPVALELLNNGSAWLFKLIGG